MAETVMVAAVVVETGFLMCNVKSVSSTVTQPQIVIIAMIRIINLKFQLIFKDFRLHRTLGLNSWQHSRTMGFISLTVFPSQFCHSMGNHAQAVAISSAESAISASTTSSKSS